MWFPLARLFAPRTRKRRPYRHQPTRSRRLLLEALEDRAVPSATVLTDKPDYSPGETVNITATGFQPGESVGFQLVDVNDSAVFSSWRVRDGGAEDLDGVVNGQIKTTWLVSADAAGDTLHLTATGLGSGIFAATSFTDAAGDFSIDWIAAEPSTYDHATGIGGEYDGRIIGTNVVESLEGGSFQCGDLVEFFAAITVDSGASGTQSFDFGVVFTDFSTGQEGVAYTDIVAADINTGDSFNIISGNETATLSNVQKSGPDFTQGTDLTGDITVTGLEAGEQIVIRVIALLDCNANANNATGNLQASLDTQGGQQTIPLKNVENVVAPNIDVELTKEVDNSTPNVGDNITYTITVTNAGTDQATGVTVEDILPAGVIFVSDSASQGTFDENTGIWDVGTLDGGQSETLEITVTVDTCDVIENCAQVLTQDQTDTDSTPGNLVDETPAEDDEACVTVTPQQADLSLAKTVDNTTPNVGDNVTFTITLTNSGPDDATNVTVSDPIPAGLDFVSSNASQGTYDPITGIWDVGTLANGDVATLEITVTVLQTGTLTNCAQVETSDQCDPDSTPGNLVDNTPAEDDEDCVDISGQQPDLELTKTVDNNSPNVGDDITFTINVTNSGSGDATGVSVSDVLPAGVDFVSSNASVGSFDPNTGIWTIGDLDSGDTETLTITVTVLTCDEIINCAQVETEDQTDADSTPGNNPFISHDESTFEDDEDCVTVIPQQADLSLTKTANPDSVTVGDNVTFTIEVHNSGPDQATGVTVSDPLPAGTSFVSANESQGSYDPLTGIWTVGTLNVGQTATLTITVTVTSTAAEIINCAEVETSDQCDPDSTPGNLVDHDAVEDDEACVTVEINHNPIAVDDHFDCHNLAGLVDSTKPFTFSASLLTANDSDPDGDPLTVIAVSSPTSLGGTVVLNVNTQQITYTPPANFGPHAVDTFTYTISDGHGGTATATVFFTLNHPPVANNDSFSTVQGFPVSGNVLLNDTDPDGDPLHVTTVGTFTTAQGGTVTLNSNGTFTYTPPSPSFTGTDSFVYTIADDCGASDAGSTATAFIQVNPITKSSFFAR
jgi:uncharacterized repeat protein (TIGR01451 family)